jgi:hypothetical protein
MIAPIVVDLPDMGATMTFNPDGSADLAAHTFVGTVNKHIAQAEVDAIGVAWLGQQAELGRPWATTALSERLVKP